MGPALLDDSFATKPAVPRLGGCNAAWSCICETRSIWTL